MSVPVIRCQRLPISAGSASPAEIETRSRSVPGIRSPAGRQHGGVERRHAAEDGRPHRLHDLEDGVGRRPAGQQRAVLAPTDIGKLIELPRP